MERRETTEFRRLPCSLTQAEIAAEGYELARLILELDEAQAQEQERRREYDEVVEAGRRLVRDYTAVIASGSQERSVECSVLYDWRTEPGEVLVIRRDSGNVVESRVMTDKERDQQWHTVDEATGEIPTESPPTVQ